jgi:hypothetical protein
MHRIAELFHDALDGDFGTQPQRLTRCLVYAAGVAALMGVTWPIFALADLLATWASDVMNPLIAQLEHSVCQTLQHSTHATRGAATFGTGTSRFTCRWRAS